jgi:hypothetical protein
MKKSICFLALVSLLMVLNCASVRVNVNYDETINFMQYRSFFLVKSQQSQVTARRQARPLVFSKAIQDEIKENLQIKGFAEAAVKGNADLLVIFYTQIHNRRNIVQPTYRVGRWGRVWGTRPGRVVHYKEGTLVIDIVDRKRQELVWQGIGNGALDRVDPSRNLAEAAGKILINFPPGK